MTLLTIAMGVPDLEANVAACRLRSCGRNSMLTIMLLQGKMDHWLAHYASRALFGTTLSDSLAQAITFGAKRILADTWRLQHILLRPVSWLCYGLTRLISA